MSKLQKNTAKGFTLIEIMIVVSIIGILTAIAIPSMQTFQCKAQQTEVKTTLNIIAAEEADYRAENSFYIPAAEFEESFTSLTKGKHRYAYTTVSSTPTTFVVQAVSIKGNSIGDTWTINEKRQQINTIDICIQ